MSRHTFDVSESFDGRGGFEELRHVDRVASLRMKEESAQDSAPSAVLTPDPRRTRRAQKIPKMDLVILIFLSVFAAHLVVSHFRSRLGDSQVVQCRDLKSQTVTASK